MPVPQQGNANGRSFSLLVQGVNVTGRVPVDSVRVTETGGDSNPTLEFMIEGAAYPLAWADKLSQDVELRDNSNDRRLFKGNLVNLRRIHQSGSFIGAQCTALGYNAWLDRLVLPKWISKRPNGTNMTTDREMVQNVASALATTPVGNFAFDAINTYVASTNAAMPVVKVDSGGTVGSILSAIAEAAATAADPTARRFYVDFDNHLHYFKGSESTTAPYLIGDASYTTVVKATSGLVSLWAFREASGTSVGDAMAYANATLAGGYTQNVASGVPNEPGMRSTTLNGTTGYASATGANLHPGNTFSVELWFKRTTTGDTMYLVSAGTDDYEIRFTSGDKLTIRKGNVADVWTTDATFTDTANWHHLVATKSGSTRAIYVDGVEKSGSGTNATIVAGSGTIDIGRSKVTETSFFNGSLQDVAVYSTALSAATALAHYNDGWTLVADDFEFETDVNDAGKAVYVRGGTSAGTGWVSLLTNANYGQTFIVDRPESTTASLKDAIGKGFLKREAQTVHGGRAVVTGYDGWRVGQTLTIDNDGLGIGGSYAMSGALEIRQIDTLPNMGSGVVTYVIYFGTLPWSGTFAVKRKRRRR